MVIILVSLCIFLFFLSIIFANLFIRYRKKTLIAEGRYGRLHIPMVTLDAVDPIFKSESPLGMSQKGEVRFIGTGNLAIAGTTSDTEAWVLAMLAKNSNCMFEFGTCSGRTAYLWAINSAPDAKVITITLPPDKIGDYTPETGDSEKAAQAAKNESNHAVFLYTNTPVKKKITQLYGDSKKFDETPYHKKCDLIFIDGSHAYSYVKSDTTKALEMIAPQGIIVWHDYRKGSDPLDVYKYLNELSRQLSLVHIKDTSLVAYRAP